MGTGQGAAIIPFWGDRNRPASYKPFQTRRMPYLDDYEGMAQVQEGLPSKISVLN